MVKDSNETTPKRTSYTSSPPAAAPLYKAKSTQTPSPGPTTAAGYIQDDDFCFPRTRDSPEIKVRTKLFPTGPRLFRCCVASRSQSHSVDEIKDLVRIELLVLLVNGNNFS
ncbi:hypothetical protein BO78DRAFT_209129 [Aspergillus sclerotiicarbonarius CBS 121057]|uniref:Uncharacterized protein n=1 Tax=Aspergillus sclerotiicarbonarius (strain CBS 121057 / IBT 28362) TaxID=1448318 RepID=A0A319FAF8_ASPSB|nr:hypothetical protein BO78DRAFT_209129 [Aspergillus sclerotiicarbonarius CBS 121057]